MANPIETLENAKFLVHLCTVREPTGTNKDSGGRTVVTYGNVTGGDDVPCFFEELKKNEVQVNGEVILADFALYLSESFSLASTYLVENIKYSFIDSGNGNIYKIQYIREAARIGESGKKGLKIVYLSLVESDDAVN